MRQPPGNGDRIAAAVVAAIALGVYLRTMYPGLALDLGDAPLFAFMRGTADLDNPKRLTVCSGDSM